MAKGADVIVMVISACDGWTLEDATIFQRLWGTDRVLSVTQGQTGSVLAGPMTPPTAPDSISNVMSRPLETLFLPLSTFHQFTLEEV